MARSGKRLLFPYHIDFIVILFFGVVICLWGDLALLATCFRCAAGDYGRRGRRIGAWCRVCTSFHAGGSSAGTHQWMRARQVSPTCSFSKLSLGRKLASPENPHEQGFVVEPR